MNIKEFNSLEAGQHVRNTLSGRESIVVGRRDDGGYWLVLADLKKPPSIDGAFKSEDPHQWETVLAGVKPSEKCHKCNGTGYLSLDEFDGPLAQCDCVPSARPRGDQAKREWL